MVRDDDDDDEEEQDLPRNRSHSGFGLQTAAVRLGDWRDRVLSSRGRHSQSQEQMMDRTFNAGAVGDDRHREYSPRRVSEDTGLPPRRDSLGDLGVGVDSNGNDKTS